MFIWLYVDCQSEEFQKNRNINNITKLPTLYFSCNLQSCTHYLNVGRTETSVFRALLGRNSRVETSVGRNVRSLYMSYRASSQNFWWAKVAVQTFQGDV